MTKAKKSPEQKLARRLQQETGRPYTQCLAQAKIELAGLARTGPEGCGDGGSAT